jgi:hypothetical protein
MPTMNQSGPIGLESATDRDNSQNLAAAPTDGKDINSQCRDRTFPIIVTVRMECHDDRTKPPSIEIGQPEVELTFGAAQNELASYDRNRLRF